MDRRGFLRVSIASALAALAMPGAARAEDHIAEAVAEINKAIPYGEEPAHSSSFIQHIDNAIDHAVMAQRTQANRRVSRAITYLRRARRIASGTHLLRFSRRGAALAKRALAQLQAAR